MILGLGIDLMPVEKMRTSMQNSAFLSKVFTPSEISTCLALANPEEHFAGKFAAKEAFMKAISMGIRQEIWFSQIEVANEKSGAPLIITKGKAHEISLKLGVKHMHVSISHTSGLAAAVVILED